MMKLRRLLALLVFLVAPAAWGATYHVTSNDKDGNGVSDQNGTCVNHATVGASWVSCGDSVTSGCTLAKPCCTIQAALDKATGNGDIVEIHAGTYDYAIDLTSTNVTVYTFSGQAMNVIKDGSASQESHRRIIRGALISTQDTPIIKAGTTSGIEFAFVFGTSNTQNVKYVTLQSLEIVGFDLPSLGGNYIGVIHNIGVVDFVVIDDLSIHDTGAGGQEYDCAIAFGAGAGTNPDLSDYGEVKNVTITNHNGNTICFDSSGVRSGYGCGLTGWYVHDNSFGTTHGTGAGQGLMRNKGLCGVYARNYWNCEQVPTDNCQIHFRENAGPTYLFNNYFRAGRDLTYIQCTGCTSPGHDFLWYFFNNTVELAYSSPEAWHGLAGAFITSSRVVNNIFTSSSATYPIYDSYSGAPTVGIIGYNAVRSGTICSGTCTVNQNLGGMLSSGWPWHTATGNRPTPYYQLKSGSTAIGVGTNNPLDQGANVCSINMATVYGCSDANAAVCQPIDCTADYEGDVRGSAWDIGADEFASAAPTVGPPAVKGSGTQGSGTVIH